MFASLQDLPKPIRANFILNVETDELFITAGLQDRVVQVSRRSVAALRHAPSTANVLQHHRSPPQVYEGLVYMDFSRNLMDEQGYGGTLLLCVNSELSFQMCAFVLPIRELCVHGHGSAASVLAGLSE